MNTDHKEVNKVGIPLAHLEQTSVILGGDRQALFDKMVKHAITMPNKSFDKEDPYACMYRDGRGGMCLVGCLIPDELYHPKMEKNKADILLEPVGADCSYQGRFLNDVQSAHDSSFSRDEMLYKLRELAGRYNLFMYSVPSRLPEWSMVSTRSVGMLPAMAAPYGTPPSFNPNY